MNSDKIFLNYAHKSFPYNV